MHTSKSTLQSFLPGPSVSYDPEQLRRDELCLQLAESLHDLGASEFLRELKAGGETFLIRVERC
jgi:hypothetical protein